jgi:phage terminase small subunit
MNATDAYCEVYGVDRVKGEVSGSRLLSNVIVKEAITRRLDENAMSASEVLRGLADIARGDMADLMDITPSGFTLELMIDDGKGNKIVNPKTKLIKKIKQKVTTYLAKNESDEDREIIETEIELYSAHDAYKDLGKYHKLFTDQLDLNLKNTAIKLYTVEANPDIWDEDNA